MTTQFTLYCLKRVSIHQHFLLFSAKFTSQFDHFLQSCRQLPALSLGPRDNMVDNWPGPRDEEMTTLTTWNRYDRGGWQIAERSSRYMISWCMILALHSVVLEEGQSSVTLHYSIQLSFWTGWLVQDRIRIGFGRWQEIDKPQSKVQVQVESKKMNLASGLSLKCWRPPTP